MAVRKKKASAFDMPVLEAVPIEGGSSVRHVDGRPGIYRNRIRNTIFHFVSIDGKLHTLKEEEFIEALQ